MRLNEKKKIQSLVTRYIVAFLFAFSWVAVGIALALSSAKIDIGGKVNFVATDIYANITGSVEGSVTANNPLSMHIEAGTTSVETPSEWKNLVLDFDKTNEEIVVTISIENLSDERAIGLAFTDGITSTNTNIVRKVDDGIVPAFTNQSIDPSTTKTLTITLSVADRNKSANGDFNLTIALVAFDPSNEITALQSKGMNFTLNDDGTASVTGNDNTITTLDIPSRVYDNTTQTVYSVTEIGEEAFRGYASLTEVSIPNTVKTIQAHAFRGCSKIETLTLPEDLSSLGDYAFAYMSSLKSFTLPKDVASISPFILYNTSALVELKVSHENSVYYSEGNCIIRKSNKTLVRGCTSSVIPSSVEIIGGQAFSGATGLTTLEIPNTVKSISGWAFNDCIKLTTINIPESITSIEVRTFNGCSALTNVTFAVTMGWTAGSTELQSDQLALPATAGQYLRDTYLTVKWTRTVA